MPDEVYTPGGRHSFIRDIAVISGIPDQGIAKYDAEQRLQRHNEQRSAAVAEKHAVATRMLAQAGIEVRKRPEASERALSATAPGAGKEFMAPDWMLKQWASVARAVSPLRRLVTRLDLPTQTLELRIPRFDSAAGVVPMEYENVTAGEDAETFGETDEIAATVATFSGGTSVSQQQYDRGHMVNDDILVSEFAAAYGESLSTQLISGTGTNGEMLGLLNVPNVNIVTYTSGSPTPAGVVEASAKAAAAVSTTRRRPPSALIVRGGRHFWIVGSQQANTGEPVQRPGTGNIPSESDTGPYGPIAGLPAYLDEMIPENVTAANRDTILAVRARDILLLEDPAGPRLMAFPEQQGLQMTVTLAWIHYAAAFTHRYPEAIASVQGTGMTIQEGF